MVSVGHKIRQYRQKLGLTQKQLAQRIMLSHQQVSQYETGKSLPTADILIALCDALAITPNDLLGFELNPENVFYGCDSQEVDMLLRVIDFSKQLYEEYAK